MIIITIKNLKEKFDALVPRDALVLSSLTLAAYILGFLRDRLFAHTFGLSAQFDAFNAAFTLPDLLVEIFVAGALSAAFIPIFTEISLKDKNRAQEFAHTVITSAVLAMTVCSILLFIFAPLTVRVVAPGFNPVTAHTYTNLLRLLSLSPIIFAAAMALGEILVARRQFLFYGLAPVFYNLGIIIGVLALRHQLGIYSAAIGTIVGALLYLVIRVAGAFKAGFIPRARLLITMPEFRKLIVLMAPKMIGQPIESLTFWFFTAMASSLNTGAVSAVNFGRNFQSVPVALIGIAFSIAVFPSLAENFSAGNTPAFLAIVKKSFVGITILSTLAAIATYLLGPILITAFFSGGAFGQEAIKATSLILVFFTLSIPLESISHLLARSFYATKNTVIPVLASVLALGVTVVLARSTAPSLGIVAIPLAFAAGMGVKIMFLGALLPLRIRNRK